MPVISPFLKIVYKQLAKYSEIFVLQMLDVHKILLPVYHVNFPIRYYLNGHNFEKLAQK